MNAEEKAENEAGRAVLSALILGHDDDADRITNAARTSQEQAGILSRALEHAVRFIRFKGHSADAITYLQGVAAYDAMHDDDDQKGDS